MIYKNATIATKDKTFIGYIEIDENGIIKKIEAGDTKEAGIDCKNQIIMPGFIDSHTHGGYGFSFDNIFEQGNEEKYNNYLLNLAKEGVVAIAGSSVTSTIDQLKKLTFAVKNKNKFGLPKLVSWYYEGPFISKQKKGAHEEELIIDLNVEFLEFLKKNLDIPAILTVAPENGNNLDIIKKYGDDFIFALGHSNADYIIAEKALKNGITRITHLYNAMSGFHHHDLGIVNALFNHDFNSNLNIELISDGVHVDNKVILYTYQNFNINNISIVSDSLEHKGGKDGIYKLGNLPIEKRGNWFYLKGTDTLSGSACPYNLIIKNFYNVTKASLEDIVKVSSYNTARNLKLDDNYGDLIIGKKANIVFLDLEFNYINSYIDGIIFIKK
ncbi:MAG: amidohydrolase family protein [Metamycoplasmataceae bacterium]